MTSGDPLTFSDTKPYPVRIKSSIEKNQSKGCCPNCSRKDQWSEYRDCLYGLQLHWWIDGIGSR